MNVKLVNITPDAEIAITIIAKLKNSCIDFHIVT